VEINDKGTYGEYKLFECEGRYYAVAQRLKHDEIEEVLSENKAIAAESEIELRRTLVEAEKWADTRGLYGLEEADRHKAAIKVNSYNIEEESDFEILNPILLDTEDGFFIVEESEVPTERIVNHYIKQEATGLSFVSAVSVGATPELIFEYKKFNIVEYDKIYYGLPLTLGPIHLDKVNPKTIEGVIFSNLLKTTMTGIDELYGPEVVKVNITEKVPKLLDSQNGYNIFEYDEKFYLVSQKFREFDITKADDRNSSFVKSTDSIEEIWTLLKGESNDVNVAKESNPHKIKESQSNEVFGKLVEEYKGYKIVFFEQTYFCYPIQKENLNFSNTDYFSLEYVMYDVSIDAIRELINDELLGNTSMK
jgi:hypothetical protein